MVQIHYVLQLINNNQSNFQTDEELDVYVYTFVRPYDD